MARRPSIGKAEFSLLAHIAAEGSLTVGEIHSYFESKAGYSRSTVTQMLERLRKKGYLSRKKAGGIFVYSSPKPLEEVQAELVEDVVSNLLDGSASSLIHFFQRKTRLTKAEREDLQKILDRIDRKTQ